MGKKLIIFGTILLVLCFAAALIIYNNFYSIEVSASRLAKEYTANKQLADSNYLNKDITVEGTVKAYYRLLGASNVLELVTPDSTSPIFCFMMNEQNQYAASQLSQGQKIRLKGKCVGEDNYNFVKGVKIEVIKFLSN